jgi:hypothetical protein
MPRFQTAAFALGEGQHNRAERLLDPDLGLSILYVDVRFAAFCALAQPVALGDASNAVLPQNSSLTFIRYVV